MKNKVKYYLFWIKWKQSEYQSIRGFSMTEFTEEDINNELKEWCNQHSGWVSDSFINYGKKEIKIPKKATLLKTWNKLCKEKNRINKKWDLHRMLLLHAK